MPKIKTSEDTYNTCCSEGSFIPLESVDIEQITSIVDIALTDLTVVEQWLKMAKKQGPEWNTMYKLYYDILHELIEAFVRFDKMKIRTHECLFAYLCDKHPELEFDWDFFEKIRTKRNGSLYYGKPIEYQDWKEIELQIQLYIRSLKKEIELKISQQKP